MNSFFNDLKNRDVIKVIASLLDFVSLGNFLRTSKVINQSCKDFIPEEEITLEYKILKYLSRPRSNGVKFYDTRVINSSCFYRPLEVIIYSDVVYRKSDGHRIDTEFCKFIEHAMKVGDYHGDYRFTVNEHYFVIGKKKQGCYESYWENGNLLVECFYKDDQKNGVFKVYKENGKLAEKCFYKDDILDGPYKSYLDDGTVKKDCFYENGKCIHH